MTRALPVVLLAAVAVAALAVLPALADGAGGASLEAGEPARGAAVFQAKQCWSCHALGSAGSSSKSGPSLDRWLAPHAAQMRLPVETLAASRIAYGGRGMPAYTRELTPAELADLVAFVVGRPVTVAVASLGPVRPAPVPPPETKATKPTVAGWVRTKRLRGAAARGASVFGREGCLSCHRYLGAGRSRFGGSDLSHGGPVRRTAAGYAAYVAAPAARGNPLMPGYRDVGAANLRAIGAFLASSRARR